MFVAFILQIVFRYLLNLPIGWTSELTRHPAGSGWCCGARPSSCARTRRSASTCIYGVGRPARAAGDGDRRPPLALIVLYGIVAAGGLGLRHLHEGRRRPPTSKIRFDWLYLDLRRLRRRRHRPLPLARLAGAARRGAGGVRSRPRRGPAYEPRQPVLARRSSPSSRSALLGLPIGHAMIAGSILYLLLAGLDMGTAAEQLLNGMYTNYILLAVPLFILAAELMNIGIDDRAAAALLQRAGRPLPRRPRPGQRACRASSSPACRARPSPMPPAPAR